MSKQTLIDAEAILKRAQPLVHQTAHEMQAFGSGQLPIALTEGTRRASTST